MVLGEHGGACDLPGYTAPIVRRADDGEREILTASGASCSCRKRGSSTKSPTCATTRCSAARSGAPRSKRGHPLWNLLEGVGHMDDPFQPTPVLGNLARGKIAEYEVVAAATMAALSTLESDAERDQIIQFW